MLFSDGLRFDVGQRLKGLLEAHGFACSIQPGLAALPTITATAKPAVSPVASGFTGNGSVCTLIGYFDLNSRENCTGIVSDGSDDTRALHLCHRRSGRNE